MNRSSIFLATMVLLCGVLIFIYGLSSLPPAGPKPPVDQASATTQAKLDQPTIVFGNPIRGDVNAPVSIVVFGDYLCAPCATMDGWLNEILKEFKGSVRVVWKDAPHATSALTTSLDAALAARCAATYGAYWEFHDLLISNQDTLSEKQYLAFAAQLGLDQQKYADCLKNRSTLPLVERDMDEATALGIDATPYVFIGTDRLSGAVNYESFRSKVAAAVENIDRTSTLKKQTP